MFFSKCYLCLKKAKKAHHCGPVVDAAEANDNFLVISRFPEPTGGHFKVPLVPRLAHKVPNSRTRGDVVKAGRNGHQENLRFIIKALKTYYNSLKIFLIFSF